MNRVWAVAACFTALGVVAATPEPAWPAPREDTQTGKGNFRSLPDRKPEGGKSDFGTGPGPRATAPGPARPGGDVASGADPTMPSEEFGGEPLDEIDNRVLSVDAARRAIDVFAAVRDNYNNDGIENFSSLEDFVARTEAGKRLEAEAVAKGFSDITDWNRTIMAVGFAYSAIVYDYATDLRQQIMAVREDRSLDEDMRARLVAGLAALMPSRNNRLVVQALLEEPVYREKLRLLQEEE